MKNGIRRDHNDEISHVEARMAHLFPLTPPWRNSSTLADESECGCGAVDTSPYLEDVLNIFCMNLQRNIWG
jgi:hypothetical protein